MRKGQAAVEYLSTYGYSLMITIVAIGSLVHFGVVDPERLLSSGCYGDTNFYCYDYQVSDDNISLLLLATTKNTVTIKSINFTSEKEGNCLVQSINKVVSPGDIIEINSGNNCVIQDKTGTKKLEYEIEYSTERFSKLPPAKGYIRWR